mgnify:CR=1 FL=1
MEHLEVLRKQMIDKFLVYRESFVWHGLERNFAWDDYCRAREDFLAHKAGLKGIPYQPIGVNLNFLI